MRSVYPRKVLEAIGDVGALIQRPRLLEPNPEFGDEEARPFENPVPESLRGITWRTLGDLRNAKGQPSLGGVQTAAGTFVGYEAVHELRRLMSGKSKIVLLGPTGAGKSVSAAAWLAWAATAVSRPRWIFANDLGDEREFNRALYGDAVVVDNVGYELHGAASESWLSAKRSEFASEFFDRWYRRKPGSKLLVTTWMDCDLMTKAYNGGMARRVYDGAEIIRIVRAA